MNKSITLALGALVLGTGLSAWAAGQGMGSGGMGGGMGAGAGNGPGMGSQQQQRSDTQPGPRSDNKAPYNEEQRFRRMNQLMEQMHRTDDRESHYQLMRQHWQEMNAIMGDLDRMPCGDDCTREQYRERDRQMEQLRDQMRLHQQEFEQRDYRRGGMQR